MGIVRLEDDSRTSTPELNRRNSLSSRLVFLCPNMVLINVGGELLLEGAY